MNDDITNNASFTGRLLALVKLSTDYCLICENAAEMEKEDFIDRMLDCLPRLYWEFFDLTSDNVSLIEEGYFSSYLDEDYYESIRRHIESLLGEDDVFLETFEEDMKYSDTPIGASIGESLADIFQPLYNFISIVKDSEGSQLTEAFIHCKEEFCDYWSQTLCNVLRALNHLKYSDRTNIV